MLHGFPSDRVKNMGNNYNAGYYINFIVVRHAAGDSVQGGLRVYLIQDGAVSKIITGEIKDGLEREVNITSAVNLVLDRVPKDHLLDKAVLLCGWSIRILALYVKAISTTD